MKNFSLGLKILLFVTPILLIGDILFTSFAVKYSREYLIDEMEQSILGFSRTVALDISRGYEISNTRSIYSLLFELKQFDPRVLDVSVTDSAGTIVAALSVEKILSSDTSVAVKNVLMQKNEYINFDEQSKQSMAVIPIKGYPSGTVLGTLKVIFSIDKMYGIVYSLEMVIITISAAVFLMLSVAILLLVRILIVKPIHRFFPALKQIEKGNYEERISITNNDEISQLAEHVNTMAGGLKEREFVKDTFSRYVPKEVVDRLLERKIHPRLEGELQEVTVFFSDIRGFTHMTERLGAEQIVHLLNRYFTAMTDVAIQYDGMIDKFAGDEIMIIFGAPIRSDDDPLRAVRMAFAMQRQLEILNAQFAEEHLEKISIGIGIATGKVILGNIGSEKRLNYSVIGDTVNLAARLVSKAGPSEILIDQQTYVYVQEHYHCNSLGLVQVKGKEHPIGVYSVISSK